MRHVFAGERYRLAGLRIASLARRPKMQRETAKAADLDPLALGQCVAHDLAHLLQGQLDTLGREMLLLRRNDLDQFRLRHGASTFFSKITAPKAVFPRRGDSCCLLNDAATVIDGPDR